jgi:hypothetical protein
MARSMFVNLLLYYRLPSVNAASGSEAECTVREDRDQHDFRETVNKNHGRRDPGGSGQSLS